MTRTNYLIKNTSILLLGKVSTQLVTFLLLPLYTAKLNTYEYGIMDVYVTLATLLIPVITLQIEQAIFRFMIAKNSNLKEIISTATFFILVSIIIYSFIYLLFINLFSIDYPILIFLFFLSQAIFQILLQVVRGFNKYNFYSLISFASAVMIIFFNIIFIVGLNMKYEAILLSTAIADFICSIIIILKSNLYKYISILKVSVKFLVEMIAYSAPLVINQLSSWLINYSDRLIIIAVLGISMNGVYSLANKFFNLPVSIFNIYNLAWTELIIKSVENDNKKDTNQYINKMINITFEIYECVIVIIVAGLGIFFKFFINENYYMAYRYIPILLIASLFSGMSATIGSIYVANKKTKDIAITTLLSGFLNVIIHVLSIKFIGLYAAALSTMITFIILFFFRCKNINSYFKVNLEYKNLRKITIIGFFVFFTYYIGNTVLQILSAILLLIYIIKLIIRDSFFKNKFLNIIRQKNI
ncbi:oligosaccharide flippase family protein [Thomasclavelia sp.]|uniref:lipopolysaccharide biosynthesis protein n=1 Tax=Thomasclavelia sp. TaxID=3025757 RepID=UPI0025FB3EC7|nr:oligosaccharide flippase family protein [Thomasclavelia sp.]